MMASFFALVSLFHFVDEMKRANVSLPVLLL